MSLLGIDVGTTGLKVIAFDDTGRILSQTYREYHLLHPQPEWSELDADDVWQKVKHSLKEVASRLINDPVIAIGVSSQGEAVVPVNKDGETLNDFVVTFDNRTIPQFDWWQENVGADEIFKHTGMPLHPMYSINKIMWFAKNKPDIHEKVWKYFCVEDLIIYRLCGEPAIGYPLASRTMAFDVANKIWSSEILDRVGIDKNMLSKAYESGTMVGKIRPSLAKELALPESIAVSTGGHDQACGAVGAGVIKEGMAINATGTVDVLCPVMSKCILDEAMLKNNYCCYPHACEGKYVTVAFNLTGGQLLKWHRDVVCQLEVQQAKAQGIDPYSLIIDRASSEPANVFILPHFVGAGTPSLDPHSKGAIVGLSISTTKADLTRGILDSINYEMRYNMECLKSSGVDITELRVIGGAAKSSKWLQMKADVFDAIISVPEVSEAASLGAAILAGKAVGLFSTIEEAIENMVRIKQRYLPNPLELEKYKTRYNEYLKLYPALKEVNNNISESINMLTA